MSDLIPSPSSASRSLKFDELYLVLGFGLDIQFSFQVFVSVDEIHFAPKKPNGMMSQSGGFVHGTTI